MMYCRPSTEYVIGDPLCGAGIQTSPTCAPVCLLYARSIAPRGRPGGAVTCGSPRITSVLVTIRPTLAACPVFGTFIPCSFGFCRTASGVSPCGTWNVSSPCSRLSADSTPYGGFISGKPSTVSGGTCDAGTGGGGGVAGLVASGESAAVPNPGPSASWNGVPSRPDT